MLAIGAKTNGTKKTGLSTMGAANSSGSLTAKQTGHDSCLTDGAHLLGFGQEAEHKDQDERGAGACHADDEVLGTWVRTAEAC